MSAFPSRSWRRPVPLALFVLFLASGATTDAWADPSQNLALPGDVVNRTEFTTTTVDSNGLMTTRVSPAPVNYQSDSGSWTPIDLALERRSDGTVHPTDVDGDVAIPTSLKDPISLERDGRQLRFRLLGTSGDPVGDRDTSGTTASFDDAINGVTVKYAARSNGLKETLVLESRAAPQTYSYALTGDDDLGASIDDAGDLVVKDPSGAVRYRVSAPLAWDSAVPRSYSDRLALSLTTNSPGHWTLTMRPDAAWLDDPARVYPVSFDPDYAQGGYGAATDCLIVSGSQANNSLCDSESLIVGYQSSKAYRSDLRFNLAGVIPSSATVTAATLSMYVPVLSNPNVVMRVHTITSDWDSTSTWNSRKTGAAWATPGGDVSSSSSLIGPAMSVATASNAGWHTWGVPTAAVNGWVQGTLPNYGIQVSSETENSSVGNFYFNSSKSSDPDTWPEFDVSWTQASPIMLIPDAAAKTAPANFRIHASTTNSVAASTLQWDLNADGVFTDATGPDVIVPRSYTQTGALVISARSASAPTILGSTTITTSPWMPPGGNDRGQSTVDVSDAGDGSAVVNTVTGDLGLSLASVDSVQVDGVPLAVRFHSRRTDPGELGAGTSLTWGRDLSVRSLKAPQSSTLLVRGPDASDFVLPATTGGFSAPKRWGWTDASGTIQTAAPIFGGASATQDSSGVALKLDDTATLSFGVPGGTDGVDDLSGRSRATKVVDGDQTLNFNYDASGTGGTIDRASDVDGSADPIEVMASSGRIQGLNADGAAWTFGYDSAGRLTTSQLSSTAATNNTTIGWTGDLITSVVYPDRTVLLQYDSARRVTRVDTQKSGSSTVQTFTYTNGSTGYQSPSGNQTYPLSADRSTTSAVAISSRPASDSAAPELKGNSPSVTEAAMTSPTSDQPAGFVVWVSSKTAVASVRLAVADTGSGVKSVATASRALLTGQQCPTTGGSNCPRAVPLTFDVLPGTSGATGWPAWQAVVDGTSAAASVACDTVTATDAAGNSVNTPVCLAYDDTAPTLPGIPTETDTDANGTALLTWDDPVDPDLSSMAKALTDKGLPSVAPASGVSAQEYRYRRPQDSAYSAWTPTGESSAPVPGVSPGDQISVELRATDGAGNVSATRSATPQAASASSLDPDDADVEPPSTFSGGGTGVVALRVLNRTFTSSDGSAFVPFADVAVTDGNEVIRQQADAYGLVRIEGASNSTVSVSVDGGTPSTIAVQPGSNPPTTDVDVTAAKQGLLGDIADKASRFYSDHAAVVNWCLPVYVVTTDPVLSAAHAVSAARRALTCRVVGAASTKAQRLGRATSSPIPDNSSNPYDATKANAVMHSAWGMYAAVALLKLPSALRVQTDAHGGHELIRHLYEAKQITDKQLHIRQGSTMDSWNDDRGWDLAKNRLGSAFRRTKETKLCLALISRAQTAVRGRYRPKSRLFAVRPPSNQFVYNTELADPWSIPPDLRRVTISTVAGAAGPCGVAQRTRLPVTPLPSQTCNGPASSTSYPNSVLVRKYPVNGPDYGTFRVYPAAGGAGFQARVTDGSWAAIWSPDRRRIVIPTPDRGYLAQLPEVANSDVKIGNAIDGGTGFQEMACSPDGTKLVESSDSLKVLNLATGLKSSIFTPAAGTTLVGASWSPAGNRILFTQLQTLTAGSLRWDIFVVNADGSGLTNLSATTTRAESWARWAPDSEHVIFVASDGSSETPPYSFPSHLNIESVSAPVTSCRRLTQGADFEHSFDLSPDGNSAMVTKGVQHPGAPWWSVLKTNLLTGTTTTFLQGGDTDAYEMRSWGGTLQSNPGWVAPTGLGAC